MQKYAIIFERLLHEGMPSVIADHILRTCGVPCIGYLTRVVAPSRMETASVIFDNWVETTFRKKHSFTASEWDPIISAHASLPLKKSGNGLRKHQTIMFYAYWGAASRAVDRFTMSTNLKSTTPLNVSNQSLYAIQLRDVWKTISRAFLETLVPHKKMPALLSGSGDFNSIVSYYKWYDDKTKRKGYKIVPHLQSNLTKLFSALSLKTIKS